MSCVFVFSLQRYACVLCVRVFRLQSVFVIRASSSMKRSKKAEDGAADGENGTTHAQNRPKQ